MSDFHDFFDTFSKYQKETESDELVFEIPEDWNEENIKKQLISIGYKVDPHRTINGDIITIGLTAKFWNEDCLIFSSWVNLLDKINRAGKLPNEYYVIESRSTDRNKNNENSILYAYCKLKRLLVKLANHCEPKTGSAIGRDSLLFFIETEVSVKKYEFKPDVDWLSLSSIDNPEMIGKLADELSGYIAMGDMQDLERKSVMISSLGEILTLASDSKSIFYNIILNIGLWKSKYSQHHDLFIQKFRVDEVLSEINQQDLKYTSSINEIISNAQGKALTIPAAFVAVSAIMKIDHYYDSLAVIVGLLLSLVIVIKSLNIHKRTFIHIQNQIISEFKRYVGLDKDNEVRVAANKVESELAHLVSKSIDGIKFIRKVLFLTFLSAVIYSFFIVSENKKIKYESKFEEKSYVVTLVDDLNLRNGPAKSHVVLGSLQKGTYLTILNKSVSHWLQVKVLGDYESTGWVYSPHTKKIDKSIFIADNS
mgnify:CR=1 FL=1